MSAYNPPTRNLSSFDSIVFQQADTEGLSQDEADTRYVRFPLAQGSLTIPSVNITGSATIGTTASITGATTMSGDITLNKASGFQTMLCSAPTGLTIRETANSQPINFSVRNSTTEYPNVLQLIADPNPRAIVTGYEIKIVNFSATSQQTNLDMATAGGSLRINNASSTGAGGIVIDANTSTSGTATGAITLTTKNGTPSTSNGLILTGTALQSATAGGSSGQHLCITLNGTLYKIALLNA
jgi:hypothetical protein